jgi:hypothetical protein
MSGFDRFYALAQINVERTISLGDRGVGQEISAGGESPSSAAAGWVGEDLHFTAASKEYV